MLQVRGHGGVAVGCQHRQHLRRAQNRLGVRRKHLGGQRCAQRPCYGRVRAQVALTVGAADPGCSYLDGGTDVGREEHGRGGEQERAVVQRSQVLRQRLYGRALLGRRHLLRHQPVRRMALGPRGRPQRAAPATPHPRCVRPYLVHSATASACRPSCRYMWASASGRCAQRRATRRNGRLRSAGRATPPACPALAPSYPGGAEGFLNVGDHERQRRLLQKVVQLGRSLLGVQAQQRRIDFLTHPPRWSR